MSNYQFEPGDTGTCRDGVTKYEVLRVMKDGGLCVVVSTVEGTEEITKHQPNGFLSSGNGPKYYFDLMPPKQKVDGFWVNVYMNGCRAYFPTAAEADANDYKRIACLYYPPREFEPGEGL